MSLDTPSLSWNKGDGRPFIQDRSFRRGSGWGRLGFVDIGPPYHADQVVTKAEMSTALTVIAVTFRLVREPTWLCEFLAAE